MAYSAMERDGYFEACQHDRYHLLHWWAWLVANRYEMQPYSFFLGRRLARNNRILAKRIFVYGLPTFYGMSYADAADILNIDRSCIRFHANNVALDRDNDSELDDFLEDVGSKVYEARSRLYSTDDGPPAGYALKLN